MSSSRIIKSLQTETHNLTDFSFRPIGHIAGETASGSAGGFVPMAMFDTSEMLGGNPHAVAEQDASQEPAGVTLTEEELEPTGSMSLSRVVFRKVKIWQNGGF